MSSSKARWQEAVTRWPSGQDLVDAHGFTHAYASVRRFAAKLRTSPQKEACAIIVTAPGEEAQVDYGTGPMVRDPNTGKYRRTRLFVLTLGYSRKAVRLLTFTSSSRTWAELHEQAFARLGGTARTVVLDNLREGVIKADVYDPALNRVYADMLAHYGVTALPCRIRHPDRKGKVEASVGHAQKTPLKGMLSNRSPKRKRIWTAGKSVGPTHAYMARQNVRWLLCSPKRNHHCSHYRSSPSATSSTASAPFTWMVASKWKPLTMALHQAGSDAAFACSGACCSSACSIRTPANYCASTYGRREDSTASSKRTARPRRRFGITKLLARTDGAGAHVGQFCRIMHGLKGETAVRRIQGVLSLARKYGVAAVEDACTVALDLNVFEYAFVRRYLERTPANTADIAPGRSTYPPAHFVPRRYRTKSSGEDQ